MALVTLLRRSAIGVLLGTLGLGAWHLQRDKDDFSGAEPRLEKRIDQYLELRRKGDWSALYEMTDPRHRLVVDLKRFLNVYDHKALKLHEIRCTSFEIDPEARAADVHLFTSAELDPSQLPEQMRASFHEEHPEHLKQEREHTQRWVWFEGDWHYLMDREIVSGRARDGREVQFFEREQS
jgi:hypothetical protein